MTSNTPFPQDSDASEYMNAQLDSMRDDIARQDGAAVLARLQHIGAEVDTGLANQMLAALVQQGVDQLLTLVRAGHPEAVERAQKLLLW